MAVGGALVLVVALAIGLGVVLAALVWAASGPGAVRDERARERRRQHHHGRMYQRSDRSGAR